LLCAADVAPVVPGDALRDDLWIVGQLECVADGLGGGVHALVRRQSTSHLERIQPQRGRCGYE
jgi:hypothetical protein